MRQIKRLVIVGGGAAGWMAAAAFAKVLGPALEITLVESEAIGIIGVGEATIPQLRRFNAILGFDENAFVAATNGTFKLGIEFVNWGARGERYIHTFGDPGINLSGRPFHHYWLRHRLRGGLSDFWDHSLHKHAADHNKFSRLEQVGKTTMTGLAYAFHFDAALYGAFLRAYAEARGVTRREGVVEDVAVNGESGFIEALTLAGGEVVEGDFFIDCSGFRSVLLGETLGVAYRDFTNFLPCNRAIAVPCQSVRPLAPYTRSTAHQAGWQWRIPLQHRIGNGVVFSAEHMSEDDARAHLLANLDARALAEPRVIRFTTGRREVFWAKNCVAVGLASGFLEPLESTAIHLVQSSIGRLIDLFPRAAIEPSVVAEYNRRTVREFESVRDFIVLHYHLTRRDDSPFWNYCRTMPIPDTLAAKLELFAASGLIEHDPENLFRDASWVMVMLGQGLMPRTWSPLADVIGDADLEDFLRNVRAIIEREIASLPEHEAFIAAHCRAVVNG